MGIFAFFQKRKEERIKNEILGILEKYFDGSTEKWKQVAADLLKSTQWNISADEMCLLLMKCLMFRVEKKGWCHETKEELIRTCSGKLDDIDLKWLLVYCDIKYIKNESTVRIICEQVGRSIGKPSPLGEVSANYKFDN